MREKERLGENYQLRFRFMREKKSSEASSDTSKKEETVLPTSFMCKQNVKLHGRKRKHRIGMQKHVDQRAENMITDIFRENYKNSTACNVERRREHHAE
ncbi:hypothetical protein C0Q70_19888 [Pomacea canaliculata]|uniref:Uncharacterized protein n=1 Tax=Pomacea canaliculata TaxID=400727 RepID=A0A2T7NE01_POMCA|nr:hypothetical protein C0Q70_19888 [Pomacea canaliculata]